MLLKLYMNFLAQSSATKVALVNELQVENEIYKQETIILINNFEEVQTQNKVNNKASKKYEQEFEIKNDDFIKKKNKYIKYQL